MNRPIGITLLAVGAALAGLFELWRALVFVGAVSFTSSARPCRSTRPSGGRPSGPCSSR